MCPGSPGHCSCILLKVQKFIHYSKVAIIIMQSYKCMHDSYGRLLQHLPFLQNLKNKWENNIITYNATLVKSLYASSVLCTKS